MSVFWTRGYRNEGSAIQMGLVVVRPGWVTFLPLGIPPNMPVGCPRKFVPNIWNRPAGKDRAQRLRVLHHRAHATGALAAARLGWRTPTNGRSSARRAAAPVVRVCTWLWDEESPIGNTGGIDRF